jgi:hypothetical protein
MWTDTFFFSFLIWLSAGDWLLPGWKTGHESYLSFRCNFGGRSLLLCFGGFSKRSRLSVGWPASGEDCSLDPPWSYADARLCKELKLVWFGDFKIQFGSRNLAYRAACIASRLWYIDDQMWGLENGVRQAFCFQLCRFVFCLLICVESGCTFLFC